MFVNTGLEKMLNIKHAISILVAFAILAGCGEEGPELYSVKGLVTHQGRPVSNLLVSFVPEKGRSFSGRSDAKGEYILMLDENRPGVALGKYKVVVAYQSKDPGEEMAIMEGRFQYPADVAAVLKKYSAASESPLFVEVKDDGKDINLELD